MQLIRLLLSLSLAILSVGLALASDSPAQAAQSFAGPLSLESGTLSNSQSDKSQLPSALWRARRSTELNSDWQSGAACYTMRSYFFERDAPDSDSTHPAGYSTCQRASRFGIKHAAPNEVPVP